MFVDQSMTRAAAIAATTGTAPPTTREDALDVELAPAAAPTPLALLVEPLPAAVTAFVTVPPPTGADVGGDAGALDEDVLAGWGGAAVELPLEALPPFPPGLVAERPLISTPFPHGVGEPSGWVVFGGEVVVPLASAMAKRVVHRVSLEEESVN